MIKKNSSKKSDSSKILVCIDKSTKKHVIEQAIKLSRKYGFKIIFFHVIESESIVVANKLQKTLAFDIYANIAETPSTFLPKYDFELLDDIEKQLYDEAKKILKNKTKIIDKNSTYELKYSIGNIVGKILKFSKKENVEFIIVGKRDMNKVKQFFLGSTSNQLVEKSKIPVLVIH